MTDYYLDSVNGNDARAGTSEATAWQTIGKINGETFLPGDRIFFRAGRTWTGTRLLFPSSGNFGNPITLNRYGDGPTPIIDGNDTVNCIEFSGKQFVDVYNLKARAGLDFGFYIHFYSNNINLYNPEAEACGNDNIIFLDYPHHCKVYNALSFDAYERVAGPQISCLEIADGSHDIEVWGANLYGSARMGFTVHSHAATVMPYNIRLHGIYSHNNTWYGGILTKSNNVAEAGLNILVDNCHFDNNTRYGLGLEKTVAQDMVGVTIDKCYAFGNVQHPFYTSCNATIQRCVAFSTLATRINNAAGVNLYNNTFIRNAAVPVEFRGTTANATMKNCLHYTTGGTMAYVENTVGAVDLDYNLYWSTAFDPVTTAIFNWKGNWYNWANWKTNSGQDANSPTPELPLFRSFDYGDYRLRRGSPGLGDGEDVGLWYRGGAPDIGYSELRPMDTRLDRLTIR